VAESVVYNVMVFLEKRFGTSLLKKSVS